MQNVQNAAEIQQRVINLVELYRTKVGKESKIAKDAKADCDYWDQESINLMDENGIGGGIYGEGPHTEVWIKHLMVNEQLLGHFYSVVAGEKAEKEILDQLLPDVYDKTIFTEDEEMFLKDHFKEMVNYIILTPCDDSLEWVNRHDGKDVYTIPSEVLELVKDRVEIPAGSIVYYPHTTFAQLANLFDGCKYCCDTMSYAWTKVAVYANNIDAEDNAMPSLFDAIVSYIPKDDDDSKAIARLCEAYKTLPVGGKLVLICSSDVLANKNTSNKKEREEDRASADINAQFRQMLVEDKAIKEIVQLPLVMSNNASFGTYCLLVAEKGRQESDVLLVDARIASNDFDTKHYMLSFDNTKFSDILQNDGIDPNTGLRKVVKVSSEELSPEILIPQVYVIERPSQAERPVPLSSLCSLISSKVRDVQYDLSEDTPLIELNNLSISFHGELNILATRKADCPNNPPYQKGSKDYSFDEFGRFIDSIFGQIGSNKGQRVAEYRRCTFVDGKTDTVLFRVSSDSIGTALIRSAGIPFAVRNGLMALVPKECIDALSLTAILRLPMVRRQLKTYSDFGLKNHLDDIIVPTDKRIIFDEICRMENEQSLNNTLQEKVQAMKTDYINEVRMRKHDMGQKVFDLINTEDLMRYYVENRESESDVWSQIEEQLDHFRSTIIELSEMLDHLSQEEKFGTPELIDLNEYFANLQHSNNVSGFTLSYLLDRESILDVQLSRIKDKDIKDWGSVKAIPMIYIAKNDLERVVSNIINNAQKHGFTDPNREDYEVNVRLEFNAEKGMYQIDFRNNGKPLSEGLNKLRYGIKGEKAGQTAGTGLGGNVVKSVVEHYKGDYDVFMDGEWTVIRILLPIAI